MIIFQPGNITYLNKERETIMESAQAADVMLENVCGGNGTCGKCKVKVIIGECNPVTEEEKVCLTEEEISQGYRLACKLVPKMAFRTCEILVEEQGEEETVSGINDALEREQLQKELREIEKAVDVHKIKKSCGITDKNVDKSRILNQKQWITDSIRKKNKATEKYGIALDIGTTNIEMVLWDIEHGTCVGRNICSNRQRSYGADVVSRIAYAVQNEANFQKLCQVFQEQVKEIIFALMREEGCRRKRYLEEKESLGNKNQGEKESFRERNQGEKEGFGEKKQEEKEFFKEWNRKLEKMVVVGNAAMLHFFAGEKVNTLAKAPYTTTYKKARVVEGKMLELPNAQIFLASNMEGFVGADTVGVLTYLSEQEHLNNTLMIDIGTNGEIALIKEGVCYVASTAAGPAFEGASISCGMRGEAGAIRGMTIGERISFDVIGGIEPKGICGSGLIEIVAKLYRIGVIDESGYLCSQKVALQKGCPKVAAECIEEGENGNRFVLYKKKKKEVSLTQKDIRELQLAKAAILAGVETMLEECGMKVEEIQTCYLAGAFGKHLHVESAKAIGLLPEIESNRIITVGNAALFGACEMLLEKEKWEKSKKIAEKAEHISLSEKESFKEKYLQGMGFSKRL